MIIIMIWRMAFATVLLKKPTTVATPTRKASFLALFLCMSSVINTDKNGMIIKPNGGKKERADNDRNHTDTFSPFRTSVFF